MTSYVNRKVFGGMFTDATAATLLTPPQVASRLSVSKATVYRLINTGRLPAVRVGGQYRVDPEELDAYIYDAEEPA